MSSKVTKVCLFAQFIKPTYESQKRGYEGGCWRVRYTLLEKLVVQKKTTIDPPKNAFLLLK